jgi:2-iminoacetate synthase
MALCKAGQIQNCCHPNALMTLQEYLMDYAASDTCALGEKLIEREIANVPNKKVQHLVSDHLEKIRQGSRDFRI